MFPKEASTAAAFLFEISDDHNMPNFLLASMFFSWMFKLADDVNKLERNDVGIRNLRVESSEF